jgi:hypothetical protein
MNKYFQFSHTLLFCRQCWTSLKPVTLRFLAMQLLPNEPATKLWRIFFIAIWLRIENWLLRQSETRSDSITSGISPLSKPACYRIGNRSQGDTLICKKNAISCISKVKSRSSLSAFPPSSDTHDAQTYSKRNEKKKPDIILCIPKNRSQIQYIQKSNLWIETENKFRRASHTARSKQSW